MIANVKNTTEHYQKLVKILGKKNLSAPIHNPLDFIKIATDGVNSVVVKNFRDYFNLSQNLTANILNISTPTLYRWHRSNKYLERNISVLLFEITDLFLYGTEVFGNDKNFFKWLRLPNTAIGGMEPIELIEIPGGVSKVRDILGRIEHGVYS